MSTNMEILLIIGICLVTIAAVTVAAVALAKRKIDAVDILAKVDKAIGYAQSIAEAMKPFLPGVTGTVIDAVVNLGAKAVQSVEATYKAALATGATADDTRATEATSLIKSGLALAGIQDNAQIDKLIAAVIPVLVLGLPKTHTETMAAETVTAAK